MHASGLPVRRSLVAPGDHVVVRAEGLVLREWTGHDVPALVSLFDTEEIDRWTPLASPFDEQAAIAYIERAHLGRATGSLQLAITEDGVEPMGEVLIFPDSGDACELAYAVGVAYRGRALGSHAVRAVLGLAYSAGYQQARLKIAVDNVGSQRVAVAAGFTESGEPLVRRERKGYVLDLATWTRMIP